MLSRPPCLVLGGPTAVGKTGLLDQLALQSPWSLEVISADAYQVYRGLDKGTAKPDKALCSRIPHHLIDICDISDSYSVGDFVRQTLPLIAEIQARDSLPVICGGTVYYLKHLLDGSPETPASDPIIRNELRTAWDQGHQDELLAELSRVDPVSYHRLHANDAYRVLRALEVYRLTGQALSRYRPTNGSKGLSVQPGIVVALLERPRQELIGRISARVDAMFADGLAQELSDLVALGHNPHEPGMHAIGYQEFFHLQDRGSWTLKSDMDTVREEINIHTRQYAKRQMTFLRQLTGAKWFPANEPERAAGEILACLRESQVGWLT